MKVTACLISWKRPHNLGKIVESLHQWDFIDEILIHVNKPGKNEINYGRYLMADKARNSLIYVQDDDVVVRNLDKLYEAFLDQPLKIANGGTPEYIVQTENNRFGSAQMALVGWGTLFRKDWYTKTILKYTNVHRKDYCFYRETDRIWTMLLNQHHNMVELDIEELEGSRGPEALSSQEEHLKYKKLAIDRCLKILES